MIKYISVCASTIADKFNEFEKKKTGIIIKPKEIS